MYLNHLKVCDKMPLRFDLEQLIEGIRRRREKRTQGISL